MVFKTFWDPLSIPAHTGGNLPFGLINEFLVFTVFYRSFPNAISRKDNFMLWCFVLRDSFSGWAAHPKRAFGNINGFWFKILMRFGKLGRTVVVNMGPTDNNITAHRATDFDLSYSSTIVISLHFRIRRFFFT